MPQTLKKPARYERKYRVRPSADHTGLSSQGPVVNCLQSPPDRGATAMTDPVGDLRSTAMKLSQRPSGERRVCQRSWLALDAMTCSGPASGVAGAIQTWDSVWEPPRGEEPTTNRPSGDQP